MADQAAKKATGSHPDSQTHLELPEPQSPQTLIATTKHTIHQTIQSEWVTTWEAVKHGKELFRLKTRPNKATLDTHIGTHRAISSIITQIRTGKISLHVYLHAINKADTDEYQYGRRPQTVQHILLECRNWTDEQHQM